MNLLLAKQVDGRWRRVGCFRARQDGTPTNHGERIGGTMEAVALRQGAHTIASDKAIVDVDLEFYGHKYRVTRY